MKISVAYKKLILEKGAFALAAIAASTFFFKDNIEQITRGVFEVDGIYIPQPRYVFNQSELKEGSYSHTFRIYNMRPRVLTVEAQPNCGCTGLSQKNIQIAPFSWQNITAEMRESKGRKQSATIALKTSSPIKKWNFLFLEK